MITENEIRLSQAGYPQPEPETKAWWRGMFLIALATVAAVGFAWAAYRAVLAWMAV